MQSEYRIGDALQGLQSLPAESVDLVVTDPAYDSLEKWRSQGTTTRLSHSKSSSNDWFPVVTSEYLQACIAECYRVLKRDSHLYVLCDYATSLVVQAAATSVGFESKKPLIWEKVGLKKQVCCPQCKVAVLEVEGLGSPGMGYPFRSSYEMVYFAQKGRRKAPEDKSVRDVLRFPRLKGHTFWPTQKPIALLEVLVRQSSNVGDFVVDPFAGSGATLQAAKNLGRQYLGFDINPAGKQYFETTSWEDAVSAVPLKKSAFQQLLRKVAR